MKKILLSVVAFMMLASMTAQNVARECVLFEVFTGVNCPYCPAAANGIVQMLDEGLAVAPIAIHTSAFSTPEFYTNETNARANYYGVTSYPTAKVDGILSQSGGGNSSQSNYNAYRNFYNQRINVTSPFTIDLSYQYYQGTQCQVTATVTKVGDCSGTDVRVFIALTQSHIQKTWQGMQELNAVVRDLIPTQNGTPFSGDSQTVTEIFDLNGYPKENCNLVAWVQNYGAPKEVYQTVMINMAPENSQYDVAIRNIEETVIENCSGKTSPRLTVKSFGQETLTSMLIKAYANGTEVSQYQWNGSVAQGESTEIVMPEFEFGDAAIVTIEASALNGHDDEYPVDNSGSISFVPAKTTDGELKMQIKTGSNPQDITFEIKNTETDEIVKTWSYEESNHVYTEDLSLMDAACYRLTIRNSEGTGLNNGFFIIRDSENQTVYQMSNTINNFRYSLAFEFDCDGTFNVNELNDNELMVYPNPVSSSINISGMNFTNVEIYNSVGQLVFEKSGDMFELQIDATSWINGLYHVSIISENGNNITKKVIVNK